MSVRGCLNSSIFLVPSYFHLIYPLTFALCIVHLISKNPCIPLDPCPLRILLPTISLPRTPAMSASGSEVPNAGASSSSKKPFPNVDLEGHNLPPSPAPSSPHTGRRYNIATELVFTESNDQYNASSVPIYQVDLCHSVKPAWTFKTNVYHHRVLPSSRPPAAAAENMTTPALATQPAHTSSDT